MDWSAISEVIDSTRKTDESREESDKIEPFRWDEKLPEPAQQKGDKGYISYLEKEVFKLKEALGELNPGKVSAW